ncbi:integrase, catalytic region, zinc finger, CCHC-type containing protein [Tanacetum coccineum]
MTGDHSQLTNFAHKFLSNVKFDNDQIAKIMGYGDHQIGNIVILRVYYVERLGHNLFSIGQFCDSDLEVAFRKHMYFVRNLEGVDLLSGSRETNLYTLSIEDMMASSAICLFSKASKTKSWPMCVASVNGKKYILVIVDDDSRFVWVKFLASNDEAPDFIIKFMKMIKVGISHETSVARTPQQNGVVERRNRTLVETARTSRSIIRQRHGKTPYELLHDRKPDLSYLYVFGALCYPNNDSDVMASEQLDSGPGLQPITPATFNSRLVPNTIPQQPCILPPRDEWDHLFQPMFDEYFNPPTIAVSPSISIPSTQDQEHSPIISQGLEESPKTPHFHDDLLHESLHEDSTSQGLSSNIKPIHTLFESLGRWTKDHPIANVIEDPSRSTSTRKQLHTDDMSFYFDSFLTFVELKNFKQAMIEPSWINAMQEEIHEFERLQV